MSREAQHPHEASRRTSAPAFGRLRAMFRWIGKHELGTILALGTMALGTLVFSNVAGEVSEGDTQSLDRAVLLALRSKLDVADPIGPLWLEEAGRDLSALGGTAVLTLLTLAVVGYLWLQRRVRAALFVAASISTAALLSALLKNAFSRPRPDLVPHLSHVTSASFPSGHAMLAATVYLSLAALLARMQTNLVIKSYILLWALLVAVLVGVSRVYVGVHWPSDVLAGWSAGAAWAALSWMLAKALQKGGNLEGGSRV